MNLEWGDEKTIQFITNVGLITSNGPYGDNIMACEWTHQVSYSPGLIAICIGEGKATAENIEKTKEFGVSLISIDQSTLSNVSGMNSGKDTDKIKALEELGYKFYKAKKINTLMVKESVLNLECKLVKRIDIGGSHIIYIGEVIEASLNKDKSPLAYHKGKYGKIEFLQKPTDEERKRISEIVKKHKK